MEKKMNMTTVDTPAGPFTILASDDNAVRAAGFTTDTAELLRLVHPSLRAEPRARPDLGSVTDAVRSYLDGDVAAIDEVTVEQHTGGAFLSHSWDTLRHVKPGQPVTYTQFAALAGRPSAIRAAATACARNAVALFVPCHRIIGTDGTLRGYRWGLDVKKWLLAHENTTDS
ncbi:putative methylated-DNA:protein-cysteine methyltransferase [Phytohabitans aurantiacus]|jgi:methylated-DNA-[protein]-cysteine S-methyltransferase|uniref:Methylated-DNA:protein-cysteine methyltransferase n=2 Tax=Phytohabitans aurantiacus TaxID=3016789 RepID=A0ABQ5QWM9_9ACTN|nr:putative methylated-DNA:protein-cysteine methyltransferase [Phytohabitans aurantiacus]